MNKKMFVSLWCIVIILVFIGVYYFIPLSTMYDGNFDRVYLDSDWGHTWLKLDAYWDSVDIWGDPIGGSWYVIHPLWNVFIFITLLVWVLGLFIIATKVGN